MTWDHFLSPRGYDYYLIPSVFQVKPARYRDMQIVSQTPWIKTKKRDQFVTKLMIILVYVFVFQLMHLDHLCPPFLIHFCTCINCLIKQHWQDLRYAIKWKYQLDHSGEISRRGTNLCANARSDWCQITGITLDSS